MSRDHWPRRLFGMIAALGLLAAAGCSCGPEVRLEDMRGKALRTPYDAVDYFRTAVRFGDWDAVFDALSPRTQEAIEKEVGRFAFATFAGDLRMKRLDKDAPPEVADLTLTDLLHRCEIIGMRPDDIDGERVWWVQLYYKPIAPRRTRFPLVKTPAGGKGGAPRWTVGLWEWVQGENW